MRKILGMLCCLLPLPSLAADWPTKPVKVVVPFAAGGATDVVARAAADHMSRVFGQPFVLDSRSGGSGTIGTEIVAKAPGDGHTLLVTTIPPIAMIPHMRKLSYDPLMLVPVSRITESMPLLAVHPSLGVKTFAEFVALAKAKPNTIHYGSAGMGSITHLRGAVMAKQAGIELVHVPYRGGAETLVDVLSGNIQCMLDGAVVPYVQSGKLNLIVTLDTVRHPAFPDTPTLREVGLPDYEVANWVGMLAPAGTPPEIVAALSREIRVISANKELGERLLPMSQRLVEDSPESMTASIRKQYDLYARVFKEMDIRAE